MDWEFGISRCKLLYIGWINNKGILYSTRNYIQYPVINCNGKEDEIMPFATTWIDLEIIILSEVSQKEKDKYHMISLICGI